jgi:hypothetical protein
LTTGIWIAAHVQGSQRSIGYVGTQGAVAFISTLIQGWGPPASIFPRNRSFSRHYGRIAGPAGGVVADSAIDDLGPGRPQQNRSDMVNPNRRYAPGHFGAYWNNRAIGELLPFGLSSGESILGTDGIFPLALHFVRAFYHGVH